MATPCYISLQTWATVGDHSHVTWGQVRHNLQHVAGAFGFNLAETLVTAGAEVKNGVLVHLNEYQCLYCSIKYPINILWKQQTGKQNQ